MALFTERNGMRTPLAHTAIITIEAYSLLWDVCDRFLEYLAWKFPEPCADGFPCCGLDKEKLETALKYKIPTLFRDSHGVLTTPKIRRNVFADDDERDSYDQYALLDYIEYIAINCHDITSRNWHSFFRHNDLVFNEGSHETQKQFHSEINQTLEMAGLLYILNSQMQIERVEENGVLTEAVIADIQRVTEPGLRDLLSDACRYHRDPKLESRSLSVEKLWDALERLKTYYLAPSVDKKASADRVINDMSNGNSDFIQMFTAEFKALTEIGNNYRIRHHETNKIEILDSRHFDYFFNRGLALFATALKYL